MFGPSSSTAWTALFLAAAVRTVLGRPRSILEGLSLFFVSLVMGWLFAPGVLAWMELDAARHGVFVIGAVVLLSHGVATTAIRVLGDVNALKSLLRAWRGK